jgi:hypothetical protein
VILLALDSDLEDFELVAAGYVTNEIPLFALPRIDGRASGKQIQGAENERDIVEQLGPRLTALLAR